MNAKLPHSQCVLIIMADGFDEAEAVVILTTLRQSGLCAKSVGLTSGLISGSHGILIMPDFTLADLERSMDPAAIAMVVLSGGERNLSSLEADPRVHRLLRKVVAQDGYAVANIQAAGVLKSAIGGDGVEKGRSSRMIFHYPLEKPVGTFAQDLVRRLSG